MGPRASTVEEGPSLGAQNGSVCFVIVKRLFNKPANHPKEACGEISVAHVA